MKHMKKFAGILFFSLLLLAGCNKKDYEMVSNSNIFVEDAKEDKVTIDLTKAINNYEADVFEKSTKRVKLVAVGDDLIHDTVLNAGLQSDGTYNYDALFANVKNAIESADLAVINQETIFVDNSDYYSGYPNFGSPTELGDALINAGFDVVTHATNHAYDKQEMGIEDTLKYWSENPEAVMLGLHDTEADANVVKVVKKNGISFGMLNYTYGLNGYTLPSDKKYWVDTLEDKEKISQMIQAAKEASDVVVVFVHWGTEYAFETDASQQEWTQFFAEQGADIVIGTHPHVVQPYEVVTSEGGHQMLVYYSLGNFVSSQDKAARLLGGMAEITIEKDASGVRISDYTMIPLMTHYEKGYDHYTTYLLSDYTDELGAKQVVKTNDGNNITVKVMQDLFNNIVNGTENE